MEVRRLLSFLPSFSFVVVISRSHGVFACSSLFPRINIFHRLTARLPILGSPWGAGTFAGPTGARQPSPLELEVAEIQGKAFHDIVSRVNFQ